MDSTSVCDIAMGTSYYFGVTETAERCGSIDKRVS